MCFGGKIDVVQQKSFGNLLQVSSPQDLSVIKTIKKNHQGDVISDENNLIFQNVKTFYLYKTP